MFHVSLLTRLALLITAFVTWLLPRARSFLAEQRGAIVVAPFFGFGAAGQIAKALVYFPWKGLNVVRSFVVPANPQTAAQTTQRNRMIAAVAAWHAAPFTALDITAWNRLANLSARARSGFNRMVEEHIKESILGNTWERIRDAQTRDVDDTSFIISVSKVGGGDPPYVRYGTSPTNMPNNLLLVDMGGASWEEDLTALTANTLYYFTIDVGASADDWGRLGIYTQRTTA